MTTIKKPHRWDNADAINGPQVISDRTPIRPACFGSYITKAVGEKSECETCNSRSACSGTHAEPTEPTTIRNINDILDERGARYGDFMTVASFSQQIKSMLCSAEPFLPLDPDMIEALEMISNKLARMLCGDPTYIDNWLDISGYSKLVADRLEREQNDRQ